MGAYINGKEILIAAVKGDQGIKGERGQTIDFVESINKFNKNSTLNQSGYWFNGGFSEDAVYCRSHPIKVQRGKIYKWKHADNIGTNYWMAKVEENGAVISYATFNSLTSDGYAIYTATETGYISVNISNYDKDMFMFCVQEEYPATYIRYRHSQNYTYNALFEEQLKETAKVLTPEMTEYITRTKSANIFDFRAETVNGYLTTAGELKDLDGNVTYYIPIEGRGEYSFAVNSGNYGAANAVRLCLFDKEKHYIKTVNGSAGSGKIGVNSYIHAVIPVTEAEIESGAYYFGYSVEKSKAQNLMVVKGASYPTTYIPYENYLTIPELRLEKKNGAETNPLNGKVVAFDGDSICASNPSIDNKSGWAGRVGDDNAMTWKNYASGGGTITAELYSGNNARHWISRNIDKIAQEYPNLDYLILEGGTNDADLIGNDIGKFGTFNANDYTGVYDDTTFCGAVESLVYKALNYYPTSKIGFIIAPKMGKTSASVGYGNTNTRRKYFLQIIEICKKWGIPYLDLWDGCPLNPMLQKHYDSNMTTEQNLANGKLYIDGQHPTPKGYDVMQGQIEAFMKSL